MKLSIVGTGMIVKELLPVLKEHDLTLEAILATARSQKNGEALGQTYGIRNVFTDYDLLLESDCDAVYIALPNHLHFSFAQKALEKGKHIIIEKPIVPYIAELSSLYQLAKKNNLIILEAMNIHYLPAYAGLKNKIKDIGDIKIVQFNYSQYSSRYDDFKKGIIHPAFDKEKYGGALMDLNIYNIHAIVGLFGSPKTSSYSANIEKGVDTSGILSLDYPDFKVSSVGAKDCKAPIINTIQGTKGNIVIETPINSMTKFTINLNDGASEELDFNQGKHRLFYEFKKFNEIIDNSDTAAANNMLDISIQALRILESSRITQ
ncbi:Gfo/Idh/MocA family protein [Lonsdalea populi]|uniref:Gfo/Idh/MocA family protein n=1 Tax=Lonsdalea populi TaxID=1172565 RepID=UPI000A226F00|nr:Gfo/Idh/MocA family oxidoreductase [Lonsdalea populi]OSM94094.1 NAD(P)-dependent oxidoreductase [Lonsdalea populi]RAT69366.1 NAD(P)-dependent oxidoreductase [Lonsdalea populi]RAT72736.1 NAD(P)-dependent oxidoreductase [Lonsdalea populi]RAT74716.1 NAD(P)-dependent oxidoreductase [Lonsdalea populi]RAT79341.1 NAD(P)-dependent oxidoreductase [Lonsdalea populi]